MQEHDSAGHVEREHAEHGGRHEGHSVADFRRRFWISLAVTVPAICMFPGLPFVPGAIQPAPGAVVL